MSAIPAVADDCDLDLGLRDIHGFEFAKRLRQSASGGPSIPIVALTGDTSPDTLLGAEAAGFTAFLRKPADVDRLETVLRPRLGDPWQGATRWRHAPFREVRPWIR